MTSKLKYRYICLVYSAVFFFSLLELRVVGVAATGDDKRTIKFPVRSSSLTIIIIFILKRFDSHDVAEVVISHRISAR